jgi:hypothetical protein
VLERRHCVGGASVTEVSTNHRFTVLSASQSLLTYLYIHTVKDALFRIYFHNNRFCHHQSTVVAVIGFSFLLLV